MAGPPNDPPDVTMLEVVATPEMTVSTTAHSSESSIFSSTLPTTNNGPIMISMSQDEYTSRTSRETVLQRLSEALLRHSLAKVRKIRVANGSGYH